jgi:site-specific DNA recombinase
MKTYFAYTRVSTVRQGEKGVSLQEQREAIERHAAREGLVVKAWFEERVTAAKQNRPIFLDMMKRLRKGQANGLLVHKIDRSARNLKDWVALGELSDAGVDVCFVTESLDLSSRSGRLSADIQAVVAADYIRNLREEARKGFYGRLRQGLYPLAAPIGYLDNGGGKAKTPDPARAPHIRAAFELYATGGYTLSDLANAMAARGLRSRTGVPVSVKRWSEIFNNPFYIGIIRLETTQETFQGVHEPLVSPTLYDQVQEILKGRVGTRVRHAGYIFRRLVRCSACGLSIIPELQKGRVYYRCHSKTCRGVSIREDRIDQHLSERFRAIQLPSDLVAAVEKELAAKGQDWEHETQQLLSSLKLRREAIAARRERLTDALIDGVVGKDEHNERRHRLVRDLNRIDAEIRKISADRSAFQDRVEKNLRLWETVYLSYRDAGPNDKRAFILDATSNFSLSGKKLEVELSEPLFSFEKATSVRDSGYSLTQPRTLARVLAKTSSLPESRKAA